MRPRTEDLPIGIRRLGGNGADGPELPMAHRACHFSQRAERPRPQAENPNEAAAAWAASAERQCEKDEPPEA
jgi:hypothetical protein